MVKRLCWRTRSIRASLPWNWTLSTHTSFQCPGQKPIVIWQNNTGTTNPVNVYWPFTTPHTSPWWAIWPHAWMIQTARVSPFQWIPPHIGKPIPPPIQPNRVALRIPPRPRIVRAEVVVMQPALCVKVLPRVAQVEAIALTEVHRFGQLAFIPALADSNAAVTARLTLPWRP